MASCAGKISKKKSRLIFAIIRRGLPNALTIHRIHRPVQFALGRNVRFDFKQYSHRRALTTDPDENQTYGFSLSCCGDVSLMIAQTYNIMTARSA